MSARRAARTGAPFVWRGGAKVARVPLWFDAPRVQEPVVLTAAAAVAQLHSSRVVATPATFALRAALHRRGRTPTGELAVPFGQPFSLGAVGLELFPSGRHLGAAACLIEADGRRLVYAGALGPADGAAAEPTEVRAAEALAVDARQAAPHRRWPPRADVLAALHDFLDGALRAGVTPVLVTAPLGPAQELARALATRPLAAHGTVARLAAAAARAGGLGPVPRPLGRGPRPGEVVLWPRGVPLGRGLPPRSRVRVALCGAAALEPPVRAALGAEAAFPFAEEADFATLTAYVEQSGARAVYLIRGGDPALVEALRGRGLTVRPLGPAPQLELFAG